VALFLSRIHPKKGLSVLIEAWRQVTRDDKDWILAIVGPDEGGHLAEVQLLARDLGIEDRVLFTGPAYGCEKRQLLELADFFVLPSHSEGFSMAVLEAMACRLPVVITPNCNFPAVCEEGAGLVVPPHADKLSSALRQLMECTQGQRVRMGSQARRLVQRCYTWDHVVDQMNEVYEWLINGGSPPACVVTD
jgi:glycosyltransferase involved in cell wall biosynthesis